MAKRGDSAARWAEEASHFDAVAEGCGQEIRPIDPRIVARYRHSSDLYSTAYAFHVLGDLRGKTVLDVGCGDGENSVLLAKLGARVTGIDISPKTIELARRRAQVNDVASHIDFVCSPLEEAALPPGHFDIVWAEHVLHHLIPVLDETMASVVACARPGGLFISLEPVNLSPGLRKLRSLVPVKTDGTPGERPLELSELDVVRHNVPGLQMRHFFFLAWFHRYILGGWQYECAAYSRRKLADVLAQVDALLLATDAFRRLGSIVVMHGKVPAR